MNTFTTEQRAAMGRLEQALRECTASGIRIRAARDRLIGYLADDDTDDGIAPLAIQHLLRDSGCYRGLHE